MSVQIFSENFYYGANSVTVGNGWASDSAFYHDDIDWFRFGNRLMSSNSTSGTYLLRRPASETGQDAGIVTTIVKAENLGVASRLHLRLSTNGYSYAGYFGLDASGNLTLVIFKNTGSFVSLATATVSTGSSTQLQISFSAVGINPTVLTLTVFDANTLTQLGSTLTVNDSTSALQVSGGYGLAHVGTVSFLTYTEYGDLKPLPALKTATNSSSLYFSSGWLTNATKAITNCTGQYLKFRVTGTTTIALGIDVASVASLTPTTYPRVSWSINDAPLQSQFLSSTTDRLFLATGLSTSTSYDVVVYYAAPALDNTNLPLERWIPTGESPPNALKITGVYVDTGTVSPNPNIKTNEVLNLGDSITEGVLVDDPSSTWVSAFAVALGVEYSQSGFRGASWVNAQGTVPGLQTSWSLLWQGQSRTKQPKYVVINMGTNDQTISTGLVQAATTSVINGIRALWANTTIIVIIPFMYIEATEIKAGFNASSARNKYLIDLGLDGQAGMHSDFTRSRWTFDGYHLTDRGSVRLGALLASKLPLGRTFGSFASHSYG